MATSLIMIILGTRISDYIPISTTQELFHKVLRVNLKSPPHYRKNKMYYSAPLYYD